MAKRKKRVSAYYEPTTEELAHLAEVLEMPGWAVIKKIAVATCAEFRETGPSLNPLDTSYARKVVKSARRADTAQALWEVIARRIKKQVTLLNQPKPKARRPTVEDALPNQTEGLLWR